MGIKVNKIRASSDLASDQETAFDIVPGSSSSGGEKKFRTRILTWMVSSH
jgi:hypothetical protein